MALVVDASVTMAWCFEDEASPVADEVLERLRSEPASVPALWTIEVANALVVAQRRGRLSEAQAARFIEVLGMLPITVETGTTELTRVVGLARRHGLSAYDAAYLELAERGGADLATLDDRLAQAARAAGVGVVTAG